MKAKIKSVLGKLEIASQSDDPHPFLPGIIKSLEAMLAGVDLPPERRVKMAGGLGRYVLEDYDFAESALGTEIIKLANEFAAY